MDFKDFKDTFINPSVWEEKMINYFINQVNYLIIKENEKLIKTTTSEIEKGKEKMIFTKIFSEKNNYFLIFCYKFKTEKFTNTGFTKFVKIKKIFIEFVNWLNDKKYLDNYDFVIDYVSNLDHRFIINYKNSNTKTLFRKINHVVDYIDFILKNKFEEENKLYLIKDFNEFFYLKSIAILFWRGFGISEIVKIKKKDIKHIHDTFFIYMPGNNTEITEYEYKILRKFANTKRHKLLLADFKFIEYDSVNDNLISFTNNLESNYRIVYQCVDSFNNYAKDSMILDFKSLESCRISDYLFNIVGNRIDSEIVKLLLLKNYDEKFAIYFKNFYTNWLSVFASNHIITKIKDNKSFKIKNDIDLKKIENFGFKLSTFWFEDYYNMYHYDDMICVDENTREIIILADEIENENGVVDTIIKPESIIKFNELYDNNFIEENI